MSVKQTDQQIASEGNRILNFLASTPAFGNTTTTRKVFRWMLLETDGWIMSHGYMWDIIGKSVGAGIYRITLKKR